MNQEYYESYSCGRKRPFNTIKSAVNFLKSAKKRGVIVSEALQVYDCEFCGKYHLGHKKLGGN